MTVTVEAHHGSLVDVKVLERKRDGDSYARKILLAKQTDGRIVQFGLVLRGRAYRGARGTAGEIGHTCIDEGGQFCYCGNRGCLETLASGSAIVRAACDFRRIS